MNIPKESKTQPRQTRGKMSSTEGGMPPTIRQRLHEQQQQQQRVQERANSMPGRSRTGGGGSSSSPVVVDQKKRTSLRDSLLKSVPFVQIHEESDKKQIRRESLKSVSMLRLFFESEGSRDTAADLIEDIAGMMAFLVQDAKNVLTNPDSKPDEQEMCFENLQWDGVDLTVRKIDLVGGTTDEGSEGNCSSYNGIEIAEMLFWEAYVMTQDCDRPPGSEYDTGRPTSEMAFQEKNLKALRVQRRQQKQQSQSQSQSQRRLSSESASTAPVCLWQMDPDSPMSPQTLVVAYEKDGRVEPASSEFYYRYY